MNDSNQIQMVVFDWAGTTVDYASSAPSTVFDRVFTSVGIKLTKEEINRPMGMEKKAHIRKLLSSESGNRQWLAVHQRPWTEDDVENLYQTFEKTLYQIVAEYSEPLPCVVAVSYTHLLLFWLWSYRRRDRPCGDVVWSEQLRGG